MAFDLHNPDRPRQRVDVLIIGAGFSGLCAGVRLREAGLHDFVILERAAEVGGTWRDNHYPGCACDIPSQLYSYSFEPNPNWTRSYAPQREILDYLRHCTQKYGLTPHLRLGRSVDLLHYDEKRQRWNVQAGTEHYDAGVVISAMGPLSRPSVPTIKGLERFRGATFHSAQWDHSLPLKNKRVAVVGTGASAIQFVPQIAAQVGQLSVFQRSAPWLLPKPDRPVSRVERGVLVRVPAAQQLLREGLYWGLESRALGFLLSPQLMKRVAARADSFRESTVGDPAKRAALRPDYPFGCKRVLISNDYYAAIDRDNVALVTQPIREVRARTLVTADGKSHPADVLIFGTGFKAQDPIPKGMVFGPGGRDLHAAWPSGPEAYLGVSVPGVPNLFMMVGPNSGLAHNSMVVMIEAQAQYIVDALTQMRTRGCTEVMVRSETCEQFNADLQERSARTVWMSGCTSWYLNEHGRNTLLWPDFSFRYARRLRHFDARAYQLSAPDGSVCPSGTSTAA